MSILGNMFINNMVKTIKRNNPQISPYIDELQNGGNPNEILKRAISNGAINRQQWNMAKPMLSKYGQKIGVNVTEQDLANIEQAFNSRSGNTSNYNGFKF